MVTTNQYSFTYLLILLTYLLVKSTYAYRVTTTHGPNRQETQQQQSLS